VSDGEERPPADRLARRHAVAAGLVIVAVLATVVGARVMARLAPKPSSEQCDKLVDRYLAQVQEQRGMHPGHELVRALDEARASRDHARDVEDCTRKLTRAQVECGLNAPNADELERCVQ
jgi:hypothetical protein